jgi:hypothetical protein
MMSVVSLETCWANKEHWNNTFYYTVASCWLFLYDLYYGAWMHEHQIYHNFLLPLLWRGARGGVVGWGTALQAGKSRFRFPMVSLEFLVDIILPAALWNWCRLSL